MLGEGSGEVWSGLEELEESGGEVWVQSRIGVRSDLLGLLGFLGDL